MNLNPLKHLQAQSRALQLFLGFAVIGAIGLLDFMTGYELSFSLFYVIPISLTTWQMGQRHGILASLVSAFIWYGADAASGHLYAHPFVPIWNTVIRLSFFVIITLLLSKLRNALAREKELARTDSLTGALNSRLFLELIQREIDRLQRYKSPFTLAYIDIDHFKSVNDQFGHLTGDRVLRTVVHFARSHLRKTDVIARLGGDEFALLLPETAQDPAKAAISKLQSGLLEEMRQNNWPTTFSIGVVTCEIAPRTTTELVNLADELMYSVKRDGRNAVRFAAYRG